MGSKRQLFPSPYPLAFLRRRSIAGDRVDNICGRLRCCPGDPLSSDALSLINDLAAHVVSLENELGQLYEEGEKHAA